MLRTIPSKVSLYFVLLLFVLAFVFSYATQYTKAQSFLGENIGIALIAKPQFPAPYSVVEVSLDDYSVETTGASIAWYIDNVEQKEDRNERTLSFSAGALGEKTVVKVVLTRSSAPTLTSSLGIVPTVVDVVLEANTHVPSFYAGRPLPSSESTVRATALVHTNTAIPESVYTYTWSQGSTVLFGGPRKGKNSIELPVPRFSNDPLIVEVVDSTGTLVGRKSITINAVDPELHFYEYSPLRGLSRKEVMSPLPLIGEETTIHGEPFFMHTTISDRSADFLWKINDQETSHDEGAPNAITLRHVGGAGSAQVGLSIITKEQMPQFVEKFFQLVFE